MYNDENVFLFLTTEEKCKKIFIWKQNKKDKQLNSTNEMTYSHIKKKKEKLPTETSPISSKLVVHC